MTVYVASKAQMSDDVFHTNRECPTIQQPELLRERQKDELGSEYRPCKHPGCTGDYTGSEHSNECPLCGETVTILPEHLPECKKA